MSELKPEAGLRFLVFGAGAIGTYIGGSLALAGNPVVFLERPETAESIREHGLSLEMDGKIRTLVSPVVKADLQDALAEGPFDIGIVAVKSYDTAGFLEGLRPLADRVPSILCLQNGVENEPAMARLLGEARVIAGTVTSAVGRKAAGSIVLERLRGVGVAGSHPLAHKLAQTMDTAGLKAHHYPEARGMKWSKMITNLLANASAAILDMLPLEIYSNPQLYALEMEQIRETLRVMDALGIQVTSLPGTPVAPLAWAIRSLPYALSQPLLTRTLGKGRGEKKPSFLLDLESGRKQSEVDFLNGAVVRYGEQTGVKTPVNAALNTILQEITAGNLAWDRYRRNPAMLLKQI